jgi:hypothetical protein
MSVLRKIWASTQALPAIRSSSRALSLRLHSTRPQSEPSPVVFDDDLMTAVPNISQNQNRRLVVSTTVQDHCSPSRGANNCSSLTVLTSSVCPNAFDLPRLLRYGRRGDLMPWLHLSAAIVAYCSWAGQLAAAVLMHFLLPGFCVPPFSFLCILTSGLIWREDLCFSVESPFGDEGDDKTGETQIGKQKKIRLPLTRRVFGRGPGRRRRCCCCCPATATATAAAAAAAAAAAVAGRAAPSLSCPCDSA